MRNIIRFQYIFLFAVSILVAGCQEDEKIVRNPISNFEFDVADDGLTVEFTNKSKDAETFTWDFGDGGTSTEKSPVHKYAADGTYQPKLTVTGNGTSDLLTRAVSVAAPDENPEELEFEVSWPVGAGYAGPVENFEVADVEFSEEDWDAISFRLGLSKDEILTGLDDGTVKVVAIESDGNINEETTANGFGQWFDADGNVATWADDGSRVFSEWHLADMNGVQLGHRDDHPIASGDEYVVTQALVVGDKQFKVIFNIEITD